MLKGPRGRKVSTRQPALTEFVTSSLTMIVASEFGQWMAVTAYYVNAVSVRQAMIPDRPVTRRASLSAPSIAS